MQKNTLLPVLVGVVVVCCVLVACVLLFTGGEGQKTYIVGIDGDHLPSTAIITENRERIPVGFDVETIQWIAEKEHFTITFKEVPWSIIPELIEKGDIDMFYSGYSITPERAERLDFSQPYYKTDIAIAVRKDSGITRDMFDNGEIRIGTQQGITSVDKLKEIFGIEQYDEMVSEGKIVLFSAGTAGFGESLRYLDDGKIDAIIYNKITLEGYLPDWKNLTILDTIPTGEEYGIAIKKGNTELISILNKGLEDFRTSGKRAELLEKYQMSETLA
ncbi:MAG TPA: ABC transporter substrate-binding protein [Methanocorpusculum sp.]|nr:ABC transporter substrate-binding protein [Methanocorpusculum sp.]